MFNSKPDITKQIVLETISQEEIFEKYLDVKVEFDILFCSPLRLDPNPTCSFKWIGTKLYFRDWTEAKAKDCFDIVKQLYQCNFSEALDIVATDFGLMVGEVRQIVERPKYIPKDPANIQIMSQDFTKYCTTYWESNGISVSTLKHFNVTGVRAVWVRGNKIYDWSPKDLCFAYKFTDKMIKIYHPMRKKGQLRFLNSDNNIIEGFSKLPEKGNHLVITKSYKDVMALYQYGINAIAPASETVTMNQLIVDILKARFDNIYSLMDNDWPGMRAAIRYKQLYNIPPLMFPRTDPKDFSDNYKQFGNLYMLDLINEVRQRLCL